jgi:hypothetical protein
MGKMQGTAPKCVWCHPKNWKLQPWGEASEAKTRRLAEALAQHLYDIRGRMPWGDVNDAGAHFVSGRALVEAWAKVEGKAEEGHVDEVARGTGSALVTG